MSARQRALACYPPSWKERYGDELAECATDKDAADLLRGAARAWLRPAGKRTTTARRLTAISTVHVSWCVAYVGAVGFLKAVDDPPVPGLTTGASQPLWAIAKATFFLGWLVLLLTGTALLLRIAVPAVRRRQLTALRPMLLVAVLLAAVLATIPVLGAFHGAADTIATLAWLLLGAALVVAGAFGPVATLRRAGLPERTMRAAFLGAAVVTASAVALGLSTAAQAGVLSAGLSAYNLTLMWGSVAMLVTAAVTSTVSVRRALTT